MISKRFDIENPWQDGEGVVDFGALESLDEFRSLADQSTVIAYKCTETDAGGFVFGVETLRAIAHEVIPTQSLNILVFSLDSRSPALEKLVACVRVVKGFDEYAVTEKGGVR